MSVVQCRPYAGTRSTLPGGHPSWVLSQKTSTQTIALLNPMDMQQCPSASSSRPSVRRRSGAVSHGSSSYRGTRSSSSSVKTRILTVQVEDADEGNEPTVLLVQKTKRRGAISGSPTLPLNYGQSQGSDHCHRPRHGLGLQTPQEEQPHRAPPPLEYPVFEPFGLSPIPFTPASYQTERTSCWSAPLHSRRRSHASTYCQPPPPLGNRLAVQGSESPELRLKSPLRQAIQRPPLPASLSLADKLTRKFPISDSIDLPVLNRYGPETSSSSSGRSSRPGVTKAGRWTAHKWCLFLSLCTVFAYGLAILVAALLTWFKAWEHADVLYVADYDILVLITLASALILFTFSIGITGTILNSRPILAVYALLLWPTLLAILAVGYTSYKRYAFSLDRKLNRAWSEWFTQYGRLVVQDTLRCCGYNSPLHQASPSPRCYARSPLPGCKGKLLRFEQASLQTIWTAAFALVPVHIANIFVSLLCANHVTRRFGKGIMPRQYRLSGADVQADAERFSEILRIAPPGMSRASSVASAREDREDLRPVLPNLPVSLRPGGVGNYMSRRSRC